MPDLISFYEQKDASYYDHLSELIVGLIAGKGLRVLDVGCAAGAMGKQLLETGKASWVTGIELMPKYGERARTVLNEVLIGNIEDMAFDWETKSFDCFLFGDVLEHTSDPWGVLKRLRPLLADDGIAIASMPNVKHLPVIASLLLHDDWRYRESGVLDVTHLRFFTRRSAARMFSETGYSVQSITPCFNGRRYSIPNRLTWGIFAGFLTQQWVLQVRAA